MEFDHCYIADSPAAPAAPEASDADHNIVAHSQGIGHNNTVKVKGDFGEAATKRLVNTTTTVTERLVNTTAAATERLTITAATATAIATTPFILGGVGGLAIWKMAGRRAPKAPTTVCYPFFLRNTS